MSGFCGTTSVLAVAPKMARVTQSLNCTSVGSSYQKESRLLYFGRRVVGFTTLSGRARELIGHPDQLGGQASFPITWLWFFTVVSLGPNAVLVEAASHDQRHNPKLARSAKAFPFECRAVRGKVRGRFVRAFRPECWLPNAPYPGSSCLCPGIRVLIPPQSPHRRRGWPVRPDRGDNPGAQCRGPATAIISSWSGMPRNASSEPRRTPCLSSYPRSINDPQESD
jgi:hypothetical protein